MDQYVSTYILIIRVTAAKGDKANERQQNGDKSVLNSLLLQKPFYALF